MPLLKPETRFRKTIEALERHKAQVEALITFVKAHPDIAASAECSLQQVHGKVGLLFPEYALIVPNWKGGKLSLRLVKFGEDWQSMSYDEYLSMKKLVVEDVISMTDDELETVLDGMYREANPDDEEQETSDGGE